MIAAASAPVVWRGWQENVLGRPSIPLWNLTESVDRFVAGSTVSANTLRELGFTVPPPPCRDPYAKGPAR